MAAMSKHPFGTTFKPGEYEDLIRHITRGAVTNAERPQRSGKLLTKLSVDVHYPDKTDGVCRYERRGPAYHRFTYHIGADELLTQYTVTNALANNVMAIETLAREYAREAYMKAVETERSTYFRRATEQSPCMGPDRRIKRPDRFAMTAQLAKELQGKYALVDRCTRQRVSEIFDTMDEANASYQSLADEFVNRGDEISETTAIMCLNRLDRCWEIPLYNPIYGGYPHLRRSENDA